MFICFHPFASQFQLHIVYLIPVSSNIYFHAIKNESHEELHSTQLKEQIKIIQDGTRHIAQQSTQHKKY